MKPKTLRIQKFTGQPKDLIPARYYFRIVSANKRIIAQSEAYTTARARNKTAKLLAESKIEVMP